MADMQRLRELLKQRLATMADEIMDLFQTTIKEFVEERATPSSDPGEEALFPPHMAQSPQQYTEVPQQPSMIKFEKQEFHSREEEPPLPTTKMCVSDMITESAEETEANTPCFTNGNPALLPWIKEEEEEVRCSPGECFTPEGPLLSVCNPVAPNNWTGRPEAPSDCTGRTEIPSDCTGTPVAPSDFTVKSEDPSDWPGRTETPSDYTGTPVAPTDLAVKSEAPRDWTGTPVASSDFTVKSEDPSDWPGRTETPSDCTGTPVAPTDLAVKYEAPLDWTGTPVAPTHFTVKSEAPSDFIVKPEAPSECNGHIEVFQQSHTKGQTPDVQKELVVKDLPERKKTPPPPLLRREDLESSSADIEEANSPPALQFESDATLDSSNSDMEDSEDDVKYKFCKIPSQIRRKVPQGQKAQSKAAERSYRSPDSDSSGSNRAQRQCKRRRTMKKSQKPKGKQKARLRCSNCEKCFKNMDALEKHKRSHFPS